MKPQHIAQTILEQIKALTPQMVFWSWGPSAFKAVSPNQILGINENYLGGLLFYVRGMKHKGHVFVSLALDDTYTVTVGNVVKGQMKIKKQVTDVYFDQLGEIIDELIEKQDAYAS
jgi:hypothetical protein